MAREAGGDGDAVVLGMEPHHEMMVGRHRIQAHGVIRSGRAERGEMRGDDRLDRALFGGVGRPVDAERIGDEVPAGVLGDLHAPVVERGKAVEEPRRRVERKAWKGPGGEGL